MMVYASLSLPIGVAAKRWIGSALSMVMSTAVALSRGAAVEQKIRVNEHTCVEHQTNLGALL